MSESRKTFRISSTQESDRNGKPPKGAKIKSQNITTSIEEIENGFVTTKSFDGYYTTEDGKDERYFSYSKKWYSKENPILLQVNDKELAEAFEDEE